MTEHRLTAPLTAHIDAAAPGQPLTHYWSRVVGAGRAAEGLRADWQEHIGLAIAGCGFQYVRFHGLFHDDMFVYREESGLPIYNFQYVDALFDKLLDLGIRPFVEFGFSPRDMARETETVFWWQGHGAPPKDLSRWAELITTITEHWVQRYGLDEVRKWYFEVWNEPNLKPFFNGTRSEYFELYAVTANALKEVDGGLRVGGPATSNFVPDERFAGETEDISKHTVASAEELGKLDFRPVWVEAFLDFAAANSLPVDFVSTHPYPTDWALDEHGQGARQTRNLDATPRDLALLQQLVADSAFPEAEIHLTEWSSSSSSRDHAHDQVPAATYVARTLLASIGRVNSVAYWTFTDVFEEDGAGEELFHGGFGMITLPGIVKPTFHAYRMLNQLGDQLLSNSAEFTVTRHSDSGRIAAIACHYPEQVTVSVPASFDSRIVADETRNTGTQRAMELRLENLQPHDVVTVEILDPTHGSAVESWRGMGSPKRPTRPQLHELRQLAMGTGIRTYSANAEGLLEVELLLDPWALALVTSNAPQEGTASGDPRRYPQEPLP